MRFAGNTVLDKRKSYISDCWKRNYGKAKLNAKREERINIYSQDSGKIVGFYQPDIVVEDKIVIEVKSSRFSNQMDEKQLYFYLRNSKYELGYLVNFSTTKLFMKRIIYGNYRKPFLKT